MHMITTTLESLD